MVDVNLFKDLLEKEKATLEEELETVGRPNTESPGDWEAVEKDAEQEPDPNDQANLLDQYQENRALVEVLNSRHREVVAALDRIKTGTYGICEVSGDTIEDDRLEADPAARTCKAHLS